MLSSLKLHLFVAFVAGVEKQNCSYPRNEGGYPLLGRRGLVLGQSLAFEMLEEGAALKGPFLFGCSVCHYLSNILHSRVETLKSVEEMDIKSV